MKVKVLTSLLTFFMMSAFAVNTSTDLVSTKMNEANSKNHLYGIKGEKNRSFTTSERAKKTSTHSLFSLTISSRPDYGISSESGIIKAVLEGANINIQTLLSELEQGNTTIIAGMDLILEEDFTAVTADQKSLTLKSGRDIIFKFGVQIGSSTVPIDLVLWSDTDGDESGGVLFDADTSVNTQGGHLWIGGGSGSSTWKGLNVGNSYAAGLTALASNSAYPFAGINLVGSYINTGNGSIYLHGKSMQTHYRDGIGVRVKGMNITANGIYIHGIGSANGNTPDNTNRGNWGVGLEDTFTTSTGDIYVFGQGGGQQAGANGGLNYGILLNNNSSIIAKDDANIDFIGVGGGNPGIDSNRDNDGLRINGGLVQVDKGVLRFHGVPGLHNSSADMDQNGGVIESRDNEGNTSTGSFVLEVDELQVASSVRYKSFGEMSIVPRTSSTTIDIGGTQGDLRITQRLLESNFENGFSKIRIGGSAQSGSISVNLPTFNHSMELQTGGTLAFASDINTIEGSSLSIINDNLSFSEPRVFSIDGDFEYRAFSDQLDQAITYPMQNLTIDSKTLNLGILGCEVDILISDALETTRDLKLSGNKILVHGDLKATGNANIVFEGHTILKPGVELSSEGNISHNGDITFESDETGQAVLGEIKGEFITLDGEAIIEKYHPAERVFRLLSSPVSSSRTIHESLQNNGVFQEGIGTHITGSKSGDRGFDSSASGNPSMFVFHSEKAWMPIPNTDQTYLESGSPYLLLVRGDRSVNLNDNNSLPTETKLVSKGNLRSGSFSLQPQTFASHQKNHSLIGNPYQSKIDISDLLSKSSDVNPNHYYVWDPKLNNKGGYVTVDLADGTNVQGSSSAGLIVEAGEAFFLEATTKSPILNFSEDLKRSSNTSDQIGAGENLTGVSTLKIQLMRQDQTIIDGVKLKFDENGNNQIDLKDASKMENQDENLAVVNGTELLSIESRNSPLRNESISLYTSNWRTQNYSFKISIAHMEDTEVILHDKYLEDKFLIKDGDVYSFNVDQNIKASTDANRFEIVFSNENLSASGFDQSSLKLYPNPVKDHFRIATPWTGESLQLDIYTLLGKQMLSKTVISDDINIATESFSEGVYLVKLSKDKEVYTTKIVKQ